MSWFRLIALLFIVITVCSLITEHNFRLDQIEHILITEGLKDEQTN